MSSAAPAPTVRPSYTWPESLAVAAVLGLFFALGRQAIAHHVYIGQDFGFHYESTQRLLAEPGRWFFMDFTSRPLVYWLGAAGFIFDPAHDGIRWAATVCLGFGTAGLAVAYDSVRGAIRSVPVRLAALAFVAFLPVNFLTTLVYAADTAAILPFALVCWGAIRLIETEARRDRIFGGLVMACGLSVAQFAKFTFIAVPAAVAIALLLAARFRLARWRAVAWGCACATLLPLAVGGWLYVQCQRELAGQPPRHQYDWKGTGEMTWRHVLWPKRADLRIFQAPLYGDMANVDGRQIQFVIERNGFTYPALLHYGSYSDPLGLTHRGLPKRPPAKQTATVWALRTGLLFSAATALALAGFVVQAFRGLVVGRNGLAPGTWIWGALGLAWFLPIVLLLPYVKYAYDWGYWLPRLVLPALWGFSVVLYGALDRLAAGGRGRSILPWVILLRSEERRVG